MLLALPEKEKIVWTNHSKAKMRYYNLSEKRVLGVLRRPIRKEIGVAPKTIAVMQVSGTIKRPTEIWVMYQLATLRRIKIISSWRYPGKSPIHEPPPIPQDVLRELEKIK